MLAISEQNKDSDFPESVALRHQSSIRLQLTFIDSPSFDVNSKESVERWYSKTSSEIIKRVAVI